MPSYYSFLDNGMPGPSKPKPKRKKAGPAAKRPLPPRVGGRLGEIIGGKLPSRAKPTPRQMPKRTGAVVPKPAPRTRDGRRYPVDYKPGSRTGAVVPKPGARQALRKPAKVQKSPTRRRKYMEK